MSKDDQLQDWFRSAEAWLEEQWLELRDLQQKASDYGSDVQKIQADLAALQEDTESGLQQIKETEAAPTRIRLKAMGLKTKLNELLQELKQQR